MVSHVMITTIQWLAHVKRGHVTTCLQWDIMDLFYKFIKDNVKGTGLFSHQRGLSSPPLHLFPFWYSPVEILATQSSIQISKWGSPWHLQSIRVCRMVVACEVSLKQCLNFWTRHLIFFPCYCIWTWPVFVLQAEDGIMEFGLCMNFSH